MHFFRRDLILRLTLIWYAVQVMLFPFGTVYMLDCFYRGDLWYDLFINPELRVNKN
jgi:hypothetical protein